MADRSKKPPPPKAPPDPLKLARVSAGTYATGDGRFAVEQASGGWMLTDAEQTNELGLPLVRGPFATLDAARDALDALRSGPAPVSDLAERIAAMPKREARPGRAAARKEAASPAVSPKTKAALPVVVREFRSRDGEGLRALWEHVGFSSLGDDDMSLRRFAQRNPGLLLVASQGSDVVGSGMGGWDGRRGWIYHLAVAEPQRRKGLGKELVRRIEAGLHAVGCRKVNAIVHDGNDAGAAFWKSVGYELRAAHQYGRRLSDDEDSKG
jgi:ribosomal protein S18 acetylase RimI-like enzyme